MARISTYTIDNEISGDDLLVGTNVTSGIAGATVNYSVAALSDYISVAEQISFGMFNNHYPEQVPSRLRRVELIINLLVQ